MCDTNAAEVILKKLLNEIGDKENFKKFEIKIKSLPCTGSNYTAALFLGTIIDKDKGSLELFAKVANLTEAARTFMPILEMYKRESFVYQDLAKIYNDIQDQHNVPEDEKYRFSKYYCFNDTVMEETLVLENLTAQGYVVPDRFVSMNWDYAQKAIKELAKFHALSFAFEKEQPVLYEDTVKLRDEFIFSKQKLSEDDSKKYLKAMEKSVLEKVYPENVEKFKSFMEKFDRKMWKEQFQTLRRSVLVHGDYRHSNILMKYEEGKITSLIPVDYQTVYYGSPINDLLYFIFTGSDEKFRAKHYEDLVRHYYKSLGDFLGLLDLDVKDIYPKEDFYADLKERLMYGFMISIFVLPYILVDEKPDFKDKLDFGNSLKQGTTFSERFNGIINDYVRWGLL